MSHTHRTVFSMLTCAGLACTASAQTSWLNPVSGTWGTAGNWSAGVPNAGVDATIGLAGAFDVTLAASGTSKSLTISNSLATLLVSGGTTYTAVGDIANGGTITVNPTASASDGRILFSAAASALSGTGTLTLNAGASLGDAHLTYSVASNVLTHSAGHTITGNGQVWISTINNGLITANGAGKTIQILSTPKTNNNLFLAQNGGLIDIEGVAVTQGSNGIVRATGAGSVVEAHGSVAGGLIEGVSGGVARTGSTLALDAVTLAGSVEVTTGATVNATTSLVNDALVIVNPTGGASDSIVRFASPAMTLSGAGEIVLNAVGSLGDAYLTYAAATDVMTHATTHTISGSGQIFVSTINNGLITADVSGRTMQLLGTAKTNNNLMLAENGGTLDIQGVTVTQGSGGVIRASGAGSVIEAHGGVAGGVLEGISGGLVRTGGTLALDAVTLAGTVEVSAADTVNATTSLVNDALVIVNPTGSASDSIIRFASPAMTLSGTGEIVLSAANSIGDAYLTYSLATDVMTHAATHTISGSGQIFVSTINNGLITADVNGRTMQLLGTAKTNNNLMLAQNGATLDIQGVTVTQGSGGVIRASGAGSVIEAHGGVAGGVLEGISGGLVRTGGTLALDTVTTNGSMHVAAGDTVVVSNSLTNNASVVVNPTGSVSDALLRFTSPGVDLDGTGQVVLNAVGTIGDAYLTYTAQTDVLTNGVDHTLAGRGEIFIKTTNDGTISPGHTVNGDQTQNISLAGSFADVTCTPTSFVQIEIEGSAAGAYDTITGGSGIEFVCDGTLALSHLGGFVGMLPGEFIDIIDVGTVTGQFSDVQRPVLEGQNRYEVQYLSDRVRLIVVCYADCDADTFFSIDDFICFQTLFALGDPYADCDLDSALSIDDFICFQTYFAIGC